MTTATSSPSGPATLHVAGVTKRYGEGATEVVAVRDVSLEVAPGEIVLITASASSSRTSTCSRRSALSRGCRDEFLAAPYRFLSDAAASGRQAQALRGAVRHEAALAGDRK